MLVRAFAGGTMVTFPNHKQSPFARQSHLETWP